MLFRNTTYTNTHKHTNTHTHTHTKTHLLHQHIPVVRESLLEFVRKLGHVHNTVEEPHGLSLGHDALLEEHT